METNWQPCTRISGTSTGVSGKNWTGSLGRPNSGFTRMKQANGVIVSSRSAAEWERIKKADAAKVNAARIINHPAPDLSKLTRRAKMRLGVA